MIVSTIKCSEFFFLSVNDLNKCREGHAVKMKFNETLKTYKYISKVFPTAKRGGAFALTAVIY